MGITTTGNARIDTATAMIAIALRDAHPGDREQDYYNGAAALRDEIMAGTRELPVLPPWRPAVNGTSKRPWFLCRGYGTESDSVPLTERYYWGKGNRLHSYATAEAAQDVADELNAAELNGAGK